jgi:hypothetical protein
MGFAQEKRVSKRGLSGELIMRITSAHFPEFYYH